MNNVGKKDFIETIEPQNPTHKILYWVRPPSEDGQ
jgi:hypothetical protein